MGAMNHVTPARPRPHGHQPASCHASSTFSMVHMSERILRPSAAWGCTLGPDGLLGIELDLFEALKTVN
eukprot:1157667-Pelagomonas_calceolata.AAC.2